MALDYTWPKWSWLHPRPILGLFRVRAQSLVSIRIEEVLLYCGLIAQFHTSLWFEKWKAPCSSIYCWLFSFCANFQVKNRVLWIEGMSSCRNTCKQGRLAMQAIMTLAFFSIRSVQALELETWANYRAPVAWNIWSYTSIKPSGSHVASSCYSVCSIKSKQLIQLMQRTPCFGESKPQTAVFNRSVLDQKQLHKMYRTLGVMDQESKITYQCEKISNLYEYGYSVKASN